MSKVATQVGAMFTIGLLIFIMFLVFYFPQIRGDATGYYYHLSNAIQLVPDNTYNYNEYMYTAAHEYGHYIYDEIISGEDQSLWEESWVRIDWKVSAYAHTNDDEGFAEAYAEYKLYGISTEDTVVMEAILNGYKDKS